MATTYGKKWFQLDLARQRNFKREEVIILLDLLKRCGYNGLCLYFEGFFAFPKLGGVPRSGCMTADDARWITAEAEKRGIEIIPMTNLVGHAESFLGQERFRSYAKDENDYFQFNMKADGFNEFAISLLDQIVECFNPKTVHIGGDEVKLNDAERDEYIAFLSGICDYLASKGIETGIWGDMCLKHDDIALKLNKNITMFDWQYYGHRPRSPKIIKDAGFEKIIICPGTQSWNTVVGTQHLCPWRAELTQDYWEGESDMPIAANEVEAFIKDGANEGIYNVLLTDWENYYGHTLWNAIYMVARCGAFVNNLPLENKTFSKLLFEREDTSYVEAMDILMEAQFRYVAEAEKLPGRTMTHTHHVDSLFLKDFMSKTLLTCEGMGDRLLAEFELAAAKAEEKYNAMPAQSDVEKICKQHLRFAIVHTKATAAILKLVSLGKRAYHKAALCQFTDRDAYQKELTFAINSFEDLSAYYPALLKEMTVITETTGHTTNDLALLKDVEARINKLIAYLPEYLPGGEMFEKGIAIPSWRDLVFKFFPIINIEA